MRRQCVAASRRATVLLVACLACVLVRFCHDQLTWRRRETTLVSLAEGEYRVIRVIDWQTLLLAPVDGSPAMGDGIPPPEVPQRARVRLIGISAPAALTTDHQADRPVPPPWRNQATCLTRDFVSGGTVRLRLDRRRIDRSRVFLAYVFVGDRLLNEELVRAGLARVDIRPRDSSTMVRRLQQARIEARDAHRGIWTDPAGLATDRR